MYIVECITGDWNNVFIVKAPNKKEAIDTVWQEHFSFQDVEALKNKGYEPSYKKELVATKLDNLFEDGNSSVCLV